jgi:hypothetical protein
MSGDDTTNDESALRKALSEAAGRNHKLAAKKEELSTARLEATTCWMISADKKNNNREMRGPRLPILGASGSREPLL